MKKIAYVSYYTFNKIKYDRYGVEVLKKYLDVSIFDLSKMHQKYFEKNELPNFDLKRIFILDNLNDLKITLKKISPSYIILMGPQVFKNKVIKICRENKIKIIELFLSQTTDVSQEFNFKIKINYFKQLLFKHLNFILFFKILLKKFFSFTKVIKFSIYKEKKENQNIDLLFLAGKNALTNSMIKDKNPKKVIDVHSLDYEVYLKSNFNKKAKLNSDNSAVFLDQILFHHPDYKLIKNFNVPVSEKYFHELRNFFEFFKKKFNLKIVVALHPRCDSQTFDYYKNFFNVECYINKTLELTAKSKVVISHPSTTSLTYPIILKKPLIFITTNELEKHYYKYVTYRMTTNIINQPFINISSNKNYNNLGNSNNIDETGYRNYVKKYIKSDQINNVSVWDIILKNIF